MPGRGDELQRRRREHDAFAAAVIGEELKRHQARPESDEERRLFDPLEAAGIRTEHFGIFTAAAPTTFDFAAAAPTLIEWLPRVSSPVLKEMIVRSLTGEPAARGEGARAIVHEFRDAPRDEEWESAKWAYGNALATLAEPKIADDVIELLRDRGHGASREMLCDALVKTKDPRAPDVLIEVLDDPDVSGHAILALRLLGPKSSLPHLERARAQLEHIAADPDESPFARRQAKKALERLDRS